MTLPVALSLLAFSAPITAAVIGYFRQSKDAPSYSNGKYLTFREFQSFRDELWRRLNVIDHEISAIKRK